MKSIIEKTIAALMIAFVASGAWAEETTTQITAPAAWGGTKPVAVWNGDFVSSLGTDKRGTAEYAVNDRYFTINNGVITIGSNYGGMWIHTTSGQSFPISIVTGLSDVPTPAENGYASLITIRPNLSTSEAWQNYLGIMINSSRGFQTCFGGGARTSATTYESTYPSGSTRSYFSLVYPYNVTYSYNDRYTEGYVNGTKVIQEQLWSTTANYDKTLGFNIGGRYNDKSWNATGMKVHYVAILKTADHNEVAPWELKDMTAAENITLTDSVGALTGGANVGVNLNGGTVTVSGVKTAAAVFVQSDTTLDFSGDSSSRLDISGPLYVADGKTLTIKLGTLSNGYRMPITMGSCFAGNNQVVLQYETPAGSTSTPVVSGTSIKVFTEASGQEPEAIDYTKWATSVNSVWTWRETAEKQFHEGQLAQFDVSTRQDSATTYAGNATDAPLSENEPRTLYDGNKTGQFWYYLAYTHNTSDKIKGFYTAPGRALRLIADDDNTYKKNLNATFAPLTIGGLLVESGAEGYSMESSGTRTTMLGNPLGTSETWFDMKESFTINREGWLRLVGTNSIIVAAGEVFDLNSSQTTEANYPTIVGTISNDDSSYTTTSGGCLKMHGEGQIVATKLTASSACLDYSDLSASRGVPYIDAQLVIDSNTSYKFPALAGAATYQLARRLVDTSGVTGDQIFSIGGHEYQAPLSFNDVSGTVVFPAVATVNGSDSEVDWSAITWDATPATIGSSDVVTLNITGNTTLDFDTTISIGKLVLNISEGAELSLSNLANLTTANGIVLRGAGTLKIDAATTISHPITVDGNVSILFEGNAAALTVSGTLTINAGKTLYVAAANWTTPALAGERDVLTATTLTNNGTITMGAITGDTGRDYTASVADNKVSVMRMTAETFAYDTYPDGGSATGWATSWGENFDTNLLRVGPSSAYPYAYYTTSSAHPYQGTLSNRGDSISFSIYADLSQTPSTGKAVIVGFGDAGTANNKLLLLYREESTVKWAVVDRGPDDGTTAVLGTAASVTLPAGGYHLYTGTFDKTTGNLQLFLDDGSAISGSSAADTTISKGMQIGNAFNGVGKFKGAHGFVMGTNAAIVAMRGYNAILGAEEVGVLAGRYPATTGAIDRAIQPKIAGKTLTVYSSSEGATDYTFGPDAGNVVIAAGNTVNVTTFHTYPSGSTDGSDNAVTINGTLNVSQSDSTIGDNANKGVVIGYWLQAASGTRKTSVTVPPGGMLDASNAYILIPYNGNVQEATLNITGGTVKTKGLYGNDVPGVVTGKVVLRDNGVLEVATIPSGGKAITKEFKHGTFRVKADAEETRAIDFSAASGYATTLDPDGHTLTMSSAAMRGAGAVTVGGSNGGTVVFSGFTSAYTGALTINDANKDMVSVTSWDNFKGTLNYAVTDGTLDLTSYSIDSAAIINVTGSGATVKLKTGPTVNVSSGATAQLYVSESVYKYDGFIYKGASSGTVEYYQGEMPTKVTFEYMNGANLLPYYSIFQGHADGDNYVGNLATPSDWKNGTDDGFVVPTTRNAAIYVPDGKTLTVTIDNTSTFGEVQLYTDPGATYGGTVVFKKGESGSMTVSSVMCVTAMTALRIDDEDPGVAFGSGAEINLASGTMVTFNATNYSAPKITGSGNMVVNASKAVTFTGNANAATVIVNGSATVSSGTLTATSLTVDGTLNMGGNTLAATTVVGTGRVAYTDKVPDSSSWATGTATTGWRGTVAFSKQIQGPNLNDFGNAYSTVALTGVSGSNTYLPDTDITTNVRIEGEVTINNGNPLAQNQIENWTAARVVAMRSLDVNGTLTLRKAGNTSWDNLWCYYYTSVLKCGDSGSIDIGNQFALRVDAVDFTEAPSGDGCIVPISLTRGGDNKADGILYGPNGVAGEDIPVTVNGVANGQMLIYGTIEGVSGLYLAVAKVGNNYYLDLDEAEVAMSAANPCLVVFNGATPTGTYHNLGTVGGFTTYRLTNQNVYYQTGKYWSLNTDGLFKLGDGTVTAAYAGDTIVIDNSSTGDFWASPADAVAATDISVQRSVTIKQGEGSGNLFDGKTFTIADGATLTISGATRAVTLGAVTFDKAAATGEVTLDGGTNAITLGGNLSGSASATITGTVIATGKTIANTLKNTTGGTIVYDGTLPGTVPTFDSSWTGTVWLKNIGTDGETAKVGTQLGNGTDSIENTTAQSWGNANSFVKFTNVRGYMANANCPWTLILEDDASGNKAWYNNNGWASTFATFKALKGSGTFYNIHPESGAGDPCMQKITFTSVDEFTGTIYAKAMRVGIGGESTQNTEQTSGRGTIEIKAGALATIASGKTWATQNGIILNGTLSADAKDRWSGAISIGDTGTLQLTGGGNDNSNVDYSGVTGTGTLKYAGTSWRALPYYKDGNTEKYPATTLTLQDEQNSGLVIRSTGVVIGSLSGSKNLRSDLNSSYEDHANSLIIKQGKNTTWSGVFQDQDRLNSVTVDACDGVIGTLTIAGDQVAANDGYSDSKHKQDNDLVVNGAVKLTGSWVGPITVSGTFGGNGTASSTVTFNAGSTYRYDAGSLTVNGGVVVAAGNVIDVVVADGTTVTADMKLIDWTGNTAPEGYFRFEDSTLRDSWTLEKRSEGLFVVAKATDVTLNITEGTTTVADNYTDITITKTGAGTAQLTGTIVDASLVVNAGVLDITGATLVSTVLSGAGDVKITGTKSLIGLTLSNFTGKFDLSCPMAVVVNEDVKAAIVASMDEGATYTETDNSNGTWTITVSAKLDFATNDSGVTVNLPANNGTASTYDISYGKLNGVEIGTTPVTLTSPTAMSRIVPHTISVTITLPDPLPATMQNIISWVVGGGNRVGVALDASGHLCGTWNDASWSQTDSRNVADNTSVTLTAGNTYNIKVRYWSAVDARDKNTPRQSCGYTALGDTGTTVWVDDTLVVKCKGLRAGTLAKDKSENDYAGYYPSTIAFGGTAKDNPDGIFSGLVVNAAGFVNGNTTFGNVITDSGDHDTITESNLCNGPIGSNMTVENGNATYKYEYGVAADGITGGYQLTAQAEIIHVISTNTGWADDQDYYTRGVIMTHDAESPGSVTVAMKVNIPAGSAGGTICEIPTGTGSVKVEYDGANDKFKLNGTAQSSALASADGEHTLVIKYGASTGAYLWVDAEESEAYTIADISALGKAIGDKIYFGSGSAATASNGFFTGLGVESQYVEFGEDVYSEATMEAALENECTFEGPLANLPLAERIKFLQAGTVNETTGKFEVPVPQITIGGHTLTGYAALNAARTLGVYSDTEHNLGFSGYNQSSGALTCTVDPAYAGKLSVSLAGSKNKKVWDRLEVKTITAGQGTVDFDFDTYAAPWNGKDYMWYKIIEEQYVNGEPVAAGIIHDMLAKNPTEDGLFKTGETGWNRDVYRIPAMAATPDGQVVMGIFDARYNYQDLGVRLTSEGYNADTASPDHYTGIDIGGVFSLDGGKNWSYPQIMIDVPNASDPKTGDKTTALTKAMELGDPCIVYDSANSKFIMMGITGGGLTTPTNTTSNAILADVVMYECTLASVQSGNPTWVGPVSVKAAIETALQTADTAANNFTYPSSFTGDGYLGILEGPGHAFVTRAACGDIPANTVVWPMQYVIRQGGRWTLKGGNFAAWKDGSGNWHTTKLVPNSGDGKNYVTQEGCITQLDNGDLLYMCKKVGGGTRPFYKSTDGVNWTFLNEITIAGSEAHQGSILRLGSGSDGHSRYAAVFATGTLRSDIKAFIGTDDGSGSVTWDTGNPITVWAGATGTADDDGNGPHGNLVYGYNSLVMLDETTLGVLSEAHGHIYFTKVDVSSALR